MTWRTLLAATAWVLVMVAAWPAGADHAVILQYHHVDEATPAITSTRPDLFAAQLSFLHTHGFRVAPLGPTLAALRGGEGVPDSTVCLTFDDAWENVAANAWPLVREYGWTFTVFVATGEVDGGAGGAMTWDRLRKLAAAGVTFGPHSVHHDHQARPRENESAAVRRARLVDDLTTCLARLRAELGEDAVLPVYAYPFGEFDAVLQDVVASLGLVGLGQHSGPAWSGGDATAWPRYPMGGTYGRMADFGLKVASLPLPVVAVDPEAMILPTTEFQPTLRLRLADGDHDGERLSAFVNGEVATAAWIDRAAGWIAIETPTPLPPGRSRTSVTAPARVGGRWYWYSHLWLRLP